MPDISEDDIYRASSQFRFWSFAPEQLAAQRRKTHQFALERARRYSPADVEFLTEEEELRLVQRYCDLIRTTSDHLQWPNNVKATAVQYLKRFYLSNSCMTYPPKEIYKTALYLASKTEATHTKVTDYASRISAHPDAILAPEYKVMQALRFTLDVKQPYRGLKGVLMELTNLVDGLLGQIDGAVETSSGKKLQEKLLALPGITASSRTPWQAPPAGVKMDTVQLNDRVLAAYSASRELVDAAASLTDAYFLYTPSQIILAAMHLSDEPLTSFYLDTKLPEGSPERTKILATIHSCAEMMAAYDPKVLITKDERNRLESKLEMCRDPSTKDMVKLHAAMKRGEVDDEDDDIKEAKRMKSEKQKSVKAMDDVFGPSLSKPFG
jgi:cyclin H